MKKIIFIFVFTFIIFFNIYSFEVIYNLGGIILTESKLNDSVNNAPYLGISTNLLKYEDIFLFAGVSYSEGIGIDEKVLYFYDAGNGQKSDDNQYPEVLGNLSSQYKVLNIPIGIKYQKIFKTDYPKLFADFGIGGGYIYYSRRQYVGNDSIFKYNLISKSNHYFKPFISLGLKSYFTDNFFACADYSFYINRFDSFRYDNIKLTMNIKY